MKFLAFSAGWGALGGAIAQVTWPADTPSLVPFDFPIAVPRYSLDGAVAQVAWPAHTPFLAPCDIPVFPTSYSLGGAIAQVARQAHTHSLAPCDIPVALPGIHSAAPSRKWLGQTTPFSSPLRYSRSPYPGIHSAAPSRR